MMVSATSPRNRRTGSLSLLTNWKSLFLITIFILCTIPFYLLQKVDFNVHTINDFRQKFGVVPSSEEEAIRHRRNNRNDHEKGKRLVEHRTKSPIIKKEEVSSSVGDETTTTTTKSSWCDAVKKARSTLNHDLHITVPCESMTSNAKSAIVVFLTAGKSDGEGTRTVFTSSNYIDGIMAIGASLHEHVTRKDVHKLLLLRDGFTIPDDALDKVKKVGWTVGTAPNVNVDPKYLPRFERYKTLYTKTSINGLSEYECVLLLDADTLVVNNIDDLLSCKVFDKPQYRVAGTLDYYHRSWYHFNTGSALWKPSSEEMNRVYALTKNETFMTRFESDQIFTNTVYPDRTNKTYNKLLMSDDLSASQREELKKDWGAVVDLGWSYNAQTHVEYEFPEYWDKHLEDIHIIHFTQRKGWQCPERHGSRPVPPKGKKLPKDYKKCAAIFPDCACKEAFRYYDYLDKAKKTIDKGR